MNFNFWYALHLCNPCFTHYFFGGGGGEFSKTCIHMPNVHVSLKLYSGEFRILIFNIICNIILINNKLWPYIHIVKCQSTLAAQHTVNTQEGCRMRQSKCSYFITQVIREHKLVITKTHPLPVTFDYPVYRIKFWLNSFSVFSIINSKNFCVRNICKHITFGDVLALDILLLNWVHC